MVTMYPGKENSPATATAETMAIDATSVTVLDGSALPAAPNIATLGQLGAVDCELILYTSKSGNVISGITRGFNNTTAKAWAADTPIARLFSAYDYDGLRQNIFNLAATTAAITPLNGWEVVSVYSIIASRAGGVVSVCGVLSPGNLNDGTPLFVLPSGYRPNAQRWISINNTTGPARIVVTTDGAVCIDTGWAASTYYFNFSFSTGE